MNVRKQFLCWLNINYNRFNVHVQYFYQRPLPVVFINKRRNAQSHKLNKARDLLYQQENIVLITCSDVSYENLSKSSWNLVFRSFPYTECIYQLS